MANGCSIRSVYGGTDIALNTGERLLIGMPCVFEQEFKDMICNDQPIYTDVIIGDIQRRAYQGICKFHELLNEIDGRIPPMAKPPYIIKRVKELVRSGRLVAFVLPSVSSTDTAIDPGHLGNASNSIVGAQGLNTDLDVDKVSFKDLTTRKDKLIYVVRRSPHYLTGEKVKKALLSLLEPLVITSIVVVLAAWALSHFTGVGFAIDAVLFAIGFVMIGWTIFSAMKKLLKCLKLVDSARSMADLDKAAELLAEAIILLGIGTFIALLTRGAGKLKGVPGKSKTGSSGGAKTKSQSDINADNKAKAKAAPKTRSEAQQDIVDQMGKDLKSNPLRKSYEDEVSALKKYKDKISPDMTNDELEKLAKEASQARRDLGVKYKDVTPSPLRDYIYDVNKARYDDPLGPTLDWFKKQNNAKGFDKLTDRQLYEKIIGGASRPNPDVDKLLGGFDSWLSKQPDDFIMKFANGG